MKIDKKIIKELSDYLEEFNLTELEYTDKDTKIKVSKNNISISNQTHSIKQTTSKTSEIEKKAFSGKQVTSPIIVALSATQFSPKFFVFLSFKS